MSRAHNSTIRIKQKTCKSCGKPCVWFSNGRCQECAKIEDTLAKDEKYNKPAEDLTGLIDDADVLVSRFVRLSAANEYGWVHCFTCAEYGPWKNFDAGHFVKRGFSLYLRHDLRNIRCQCHACNRHKDGRAAIFSVNLEKEQPGLPEILLQESRLTYGITREDLRIIISDMTEKLSKIKSKS